MGAWRERAAAPGPLLLCRSRAAFRAVKGTRTSRQPEPLCPVMKPAVQVCAAIAGRASVETCLQATFPCSEGARL